METWQVKISDIGNGNYCVTATVTDDTKPVGKQMATVLILSTRFDTPEQKTSTWADIKATYAARIAKVDPVIALEAEAKTYLEKP